MNTKKYMQTDSKWGSLGYPKSPCTIRNDGCGEVAVANVIIEMQKYANYTPATIQPYCKQFADAKCNGTLWSGIPKMMKNYGLTEVQEHATMDKLWKELAKGNRVAIYLMGSRKGGSKKVHWTSGGHFVCSVGYKVQNGKHYVYVKDSYSNSSLRNGWISYEENMRSDVLKVWSGKLNGTLTGATTTAAKASSGKLSVDGVGGKNTVKALQKHFGTTVDGVISGQKKNQKSYRPALHSFTNGKGGSNCVKKMQKWCGVTQDGYWGKGTSAGLQKRLRDLGFLAKGEKIDGIFGVKSMKALQKYLNATDKPTYPTTTKKTTSTTTNKTTTTTTTSSVSAVAQKIISYATTYAWPYGTASKKYAYKTGSAKSAYKKALKAKMGKKAKVSQTDCGYFVSTCVRMAMNNKFLALPGSYKSSYPKVPSGLSIVHKGKITSGVLKPGDIIRYRKKSGQHTVIYLGDGKIAHASRSNAFPRIQKKSPWNNSNVKKSTIQVIRAK